MEVWKPVVDWEEYYEVSSHGRVRRRANSPVRYKTQKILSPKELKRPTGKGYLQVTLKNIERGASTRYIHRLVCEAFQGSPSDPTLHCCHNDGDKHNNHPGNLRWDTKTANEKDRLAHGTSNRGERHGLSKLTESDVQQIRHQLAKGRKQAEIADQFGVSQATISGIKCARRWAYD